MNICNQLIELTCKNCIFVSGDVKSLKCCISYQKLEWNKPVSSQSFCGDGLWVAVSSHGEIALVDRIEAVKIFMKFSLAEYFENEGILDENEVVSFSDDLPVEFNNGYQGNGYPMTDVEYMIENRLVDVHAKLDSLLNLVSMVHDLYSDGSKIKSKKK